MSLILKPFAMLLLFLYNLVNNYGIALILFALIVKLILFPFSLKGKKGMIKMNMLNAETQKLQKMYAKNQARYNEEVQKLYEREGVNPMGGCLWTMVPLFILIPLYGIIRQPMQYMMDLSAEQMALAANALNWDTVAVEMGWVAQSAIDKAIEAAQKAGTVISGFNSNGYNELYLAGMINESNLATVQAAVGDGAKVFAMNFNFFGIDLSQIPNWQFWGNGMDWTTIGLFLLVVISGLTSVISSKVMMKTNNMNNNQQQNEQAARTNKTMMWMGPVMAVWFGFMMPGLLTIYWIANNVLAMAQEFISGRILKSDYEKAAKMQAENIAREKEEEKKRRRELAEKRAREAEEAKKNKKLAAELKAAEDKGDSAVIPFSRVGMRAYARGRAYDPERFGGVTPYKDPDILAKEREEAAKQAEEAKKNKKKKKNVEEKPVEQPKPVEEKVTAAPVVEEVAAPVSEEAVEEAVETVVEDTKAEE